MRTRYLILTLLCLLALPAQAAAASTHNFLGTLASAIPQPAPFPLPPSSQPLGDACGVAVDNETGRRYVAEYNQDLVRVFGPGPPNEYLGAITGPGEEHAVCDLALDAGGQLYANQLHQGVIKLPGLTSVDPVRSTGLSVGPADNRIYVAHRHSVSVYKPGGLEAAFTLGDSASLGDAYGIAVSAAGLVYVGDAADNTVKVFDPATPLNPPAVIDGSGTPGGGFTDLADTDLAIDPTNGRLLVIDNLQPGYEHPLAAVDEFTATGAYVGQISHWKATVMEKTTPFTLSHAEPTGLTVDSAGTIYVTSGNDTGSVLYGFGAGTIETAPLRVSTAGTGSGHITSQLAAISASQFTGIECGLLCASEFPAGTAITLNATPEPHSTFVGWSLAGSPGSCLGTASCHFPLFSTTEVTATFAPTPQKTLTVTPAGSGTGTVTSAPFGLDCGGGCSSSFDQGAKVTLTAEATPGSTFTGFSGDCSGTGPCQLKLDADREVTANFAAIQRPAPPDPGHDPLSLAISVGGDGFGTVTSDPAGIDCGTPCSASYAPGTAVTLTATPDSESHFGSWSGCDTATANRCVLTLTASRTISASFAPGPPLELGALKVKGAKATLAVGVPEAGTLSASAKLLVPASVKAKQAGSVSLPLALTKAGRKALANAGGGRLKLKARITFKPSGGGAPITLFKSVTFKKRTK